MKPVASTFAAVLLLAGLAAPATATVTLIETGCAQCGPGELLPEVATFDAFDSAGSYSATIPGLDVKGQPGVTGDPNFSFGWGVDVLAPKDTCLTPVVGETLGCQFTVNWRDTSAGLDFSVLYEHFDGPAYYIDIQGADGAFSGQVGSDGSLPGCFDVPQPSICDVTGVFQGNITAGIPEPASLAILTVAFTLLTLWTNRRNRKTYPWLGKEAEDA